MSTRAGFWKELLLGHVVLAVVVCLILSFAWTGYVASDDGYYLTTGLGWLHQFPYVAEHFGTVRAVVGIPIAIMVGLFGEREFTVVLSTCLFLAATALLTFAILTTLLSPRAALVASALMVTLPLLALKATIPSADLPELFFVATSFWLFWLACQKERRFWLLMLAGISAGFAFSAHELTVALLIFYGMLFVAGFGIRRREYWVMALGFLAVIAAESAYYVVMTGDPFYRFGLLLNGTQVSDRIEVDSLETAAGGTLHVWEPIDPLIMFFTKHEFGLLGFFAIPALWWVFTARRKDRSLPATTARLLTGLAIVWFLFSAIALQRLTLLPRYYMVSAYALFLVVAIWAAVDLWPRRPRLVVAGAAVFLLVNLGAIYVDNKNPRFGERSLVEYLQISNETVHTDPMTANKAQEYCRWAHMDCSRIVSSPPSAGVLFFYNPKNAGRPNRFVSPDAVRLYQPAPTWREIWRQHEPRRLAGVALEWLGLSPFVPAGLYAKLDRPNPSVSVLRTGD